MGTVTYLVLNASVLALVLLSLWRFIQRDKKTWWVMTLHMVPLTILFDNLCIQLGFFWYSPETIIGIRLWLMPIEDLFYTLVAMLAVPALWKLFSGKKEKENAE